MAVACASVLAGMTGWLGIPVTTQAASTWSVQLTTPSAYVTPGQPAPLTATVTGTGWGQVVIYDGQYSNPQSIQACSTSPCTVNATQPYRESADYYYAVVTAPPLSFQELAQSADLFVVWGQPSDACYDGAGKRLNLFDGFIGGSYMRLGTDVRADGSELVCYRIDNASVEQFGGMLKSPGSVSTDNGGTVCSTSSGNLAPGPRPLISGSAGTVPFSGDLYEDSGGDLWACIQIGSVGERFVFSALGGSSPVAAQADNGANPEPSPPFYVAPSNPSGTCQASGGSQLLNARAAGVDGLTGADPLYLAIATPNSNTTDICFALPAVFQPGLLPPYVGGVVTVNGATPPIVSTNLSPCTFPLVQLVTPTQLLLASSPPGSLPATVCAAAAGQKFAITVNAEGSPPGSPVQVALDPGLPA